MMPFVKLWHIGKGASHCWPGPSYTAKRLAKDVGRGEPSQN